MEICSLGTSGITAERFFLTLKESAISAVVDTRLHPNSQLAGFAKQGNLIYFLPEILGIPYFHEPLLTPLDGELKAYRRNEIDWELYEKKYLQLLEDRDLKTNLERNGWGETPLLLCSEPQPTHCHRRLAADFLKNIFPDISEIKHLSG